MCRDLGALLNPLPIFGNLPIFCLPPQMLCMSRCQDNTNNPAGGQDSQETRGPGPTNRTWADLGPDNFCGEIKVLESDRFLFSQHLSNPGRDWARLMRGKCGSNHVYTGHSPHDLDTGHCINICQSLSWGSGHNPGSLLDYGVRW